MKRVLALMLVVAAVAATAIAVGAATAAPAKKQDTSLSGAGSSFVFPLVSKWIPALGSAYGYSVSYNPIGSGGGIAAITASTVDFGASDAPLSPTRPPPARAASRSRGRCRRRRSSTTCPNIKCSLRLNGPILAKIYLGEITTWNDAAITKINPKCTLPATKITPVYRSDNSGTTYNLTDYLSCGEPGVEVEARCRVRASSGRPVRVRAVARASPA